MDLNTDGTGWGREASRHGGGLQDFDDRLIPRGSADTSGGGGPGGGTLPLMPEGGFRT